MSQIKIEKFTNLLGQTRFRLNFGPRPGKSDNRSLRVWETRSGALKALERSR